MQVPTWTMPLTDSLRQTLLEAVLHTLCGADEAIDRQRLESVRNVLQGRSTGVELTKLEWALLENDLLTWTVHDCDKAIDRERIQAGCAVGIAMETMLKRPADGSRVVDEKVEPKKQEQPSLF